MTAVATRGTSNGNDRGSSYTRRRRRQWLIENYASNVPGLCRCYRCGWLLYNPDTQQVDPQTGVAMFSDEMWTNHGTQLYSAAAMTVDRIIPGAHGGTYRRNNIRPACGRCNSETGGATRSKK